MWMKRRQLTSLILALLCAGCAAGFSGQALDLVDRSITFAEIKGNPERYQEKWVLLGGQIIETRNTQEGAVIEVLQIPLNRQGRPLDTDDTEGRFIIESSEFLDSALYRAGKRISVIGQVKGLKVQPLGEINYRYPVVTAREFRLWEPRTSPHFSFGFGVFHQF